MKLANTRNRVDPHLFPAQSDLLRLWDGGTRLALLNPSPGEYKWDKLDAHLDASEAAGMESIYVFGSTPGWAAVTVPNHPPSAWNDNPDGNCPMDLVALTDFTFALMEHAGSRLKYFETWNEWNASNFYCGTLDQLVAMHDTIWTIVKRLQPEALVTTPTPCWFPSSAEWPTVDTAMSSFLEIAAPFDIVTLHGYILNGKPARDIQPTLAAMMDMLDARGVTAPVWDTEYGPNDPNNIPADQRRLWVYDSVVVRQQMGLELACWYQWDNQTHGPMVDLDGKWTDYGRAWKDLWEAAHAEEDISATGGDPDDDDDYGMQTQHNA